MKVLLAVLVLCLLVGCRPGATPTPTIPTPTPIPTATTVMPTPTIVVWPTSSTPAPELAVLPVGYATVFAETQHGISGKAIMAGLQTLIITDFAFDGQGPVADIRLVMEGDFDNAVIVLANLEQRPYDREVLILVVPSHLQPGEADSIAVYCPETKTTYAWGRFQ